MVKDHRFDVSTSNVQRLLQGDMQSFLDEIMINKLYSDYHITL